MAKKQRDYGKALDSLSQLESHMLSDNSPLTKALKAYMAPIEAQVKAGKLTEKQYKAAGGKFVNDWVNQNMFGGEGIPTDEELKGPMLQLERQRRAQMAQSDPRNAELMAAGGAPQPPADEGEFGPLGRQQQALATLRSLLPPDDKPPTPQQQQMPRMQVARQSSVGNEYGQGGGGGGGAHMPMPNTVIDPYGRPIDSPSQQLDSTNDPQEIARRVAEGQRMQDYMQGRYYLAANTPTDSNTQYAELPADASTEQQIGDAQMRMLLQLAAPRSQMTINKQPIR